MSSKVSDVACYTVHYNRCHLGLCLMMNMHFDIRSLFYCLGPNFSFFSGLG
jgi:hypothetical protein